MNLQNVLALVVTLGWLLPSAACAQAPTRRAPARQAADPSGSVIVAEVGDEAITLDDVDKTALLADVAAFGGLKLNQALYTSRSRTIEELVADTLVKIAAEERGLSADEVLAQEIRDKVDPVEDADIEAWFAANQGRLGARSLDQVRDPIRVLLEEQRHREALDAFVGRMREKVAVRILLDPPRVDIQIAANDPKYGPDGAPIQIIEFSDFQ